MRGNYALALVIIAFQSSPAQFEISGCDSRISGMGGACVSLTGYPNSVFHNPAGLVNIENRTASVFYEPSLYGITEISTVALTYAEPFRFGVFGIGIRTFGFELYRETRLSVSFGTVIGGTVYTGVSAGIYNLAIQGYGSAIAPGIDAGFITGITDELKLGLAIKNLTGSRIGESQQKISRSITAGLSFEPVADVKILADFEKYTDTQINVRFGSEYSPTKNFSLRAGLCTEPASYSLGAGAGYSFADIDASFTVTEPLGITSRLNLTFTF